MGWTVRGSNPGGGGEIFRTGPDRPWGPPSLLYNGYRVSLGVKSGRGMTLTPHPLLVPWSRKGRAIPLLPLWAVRPVQTLSTCTRVHFTVPFTLHGKCIQSYWRLKWILILILRCGNGNFETEHWIEEKIRSETLNFCSLWGGIACQAGNWPSTTRVPFYLCPSRFCVILPITSESGGSIPKHNDAWPWSQQPSSIYFSG